MTITSKLFINLITLSILGAACASAQVTGRRGGDLVRQPPVPAAETGVNRTAAYGTVTGTVSWSRSVGLPPMHPGAATEYANFCGLIAIHAKATVGHAGSFGQFEIVGRAYGQPVEAENARRGRLYVCSYTIHGLPKDTSLLIDAEFIDSRTFESEPWISAFTQSGRAVPPAGSVRVFAGGGSVTLTNDQGSAEVDFQIRYAPQPSTPR